MKHPNPIVHFEIPAEDVARAKDFYEKTFNWHIEKFSMQAGDYYIVRTTEVDENKMPLKPGSINGGLMKRNNPGQPFMNYISVESIDHKLKQIEKNNGKIVLPKQEIGKGMGFLAAFKDTEGNLVGLHEEFKKSK